MQPSERGRLSLHARFRLLLPQGPWVATRANISNVPPKKSDDSQSTRDAGKGNRSTDTLALKNICASSFLQAISEFNGQFVACLGLGT